MSEIIIGFSLDDDAINYCLDCSIKLNSLDNYKPITLNYNSGNLVCVDCGRDLALVKGDVTLLTEPALKDNVILTLSKDELLYLRLGIASFTKEIIDQNTSITKNNDDFDVNEVNIATMKLLISLREKLDKLL